MFMANMQRLIVACLAVLISATITNGRTTSDEDHETYRHGQENVNRYLTVSNKLNKNHLKQKLPLLVLTKKELTDSLQRALSSMFFRQNNSYNNERIKDGDEKISNKYFDYKTEANSPEIVAPTNASERSRQPKRMKDKQKAKLRILNNTTPALIEIVNKLQDSVNAISDNLKLTKSILAHNDNLSNIEKYLEPLKVRPQLHSRIKRNVLNEVRTNNNTNVKEKNATNTKNVTKNVFTDVPDEKEVEKILEGAVNGTEKPCNDSVNVDGRRLYNVETSLPVKKKLLNYLDLTYEEILNKLTPLSKIKQLFSNDDVYKIGYILANIDTLEANIKILKRDMDENKTSWTDERILEHFDKLMVSNKVITNLVEALNSYTKHNSPIDDLTRLIPENVKEIYA